MLKLGSFTSAQINERLQSLAIDGVGGLGDYARESTERIIRTLNLIPPAAVDVLEIGANPYFLTILAKWFRPELRFTLTNYFGGDTREMTQSAILQGMDGQAKQYSFSSTNINVETTTLPYADASFDCVLFCEVIEHLTNDPLPAMAEIRRTLKPNGTLVLTTPNPARMENVARMMGGHNIYDPYSGHGPYGRHNREYTKHELWLLLQHCGFSPEILDTHDVHHNNSTGFFPEIDKLRKLLEFRAPDLGQYHFTRSRRGELAKTGRPDWLFRSYPASEMATS